MSAVDLRVDWCSYQAAKYAVEHWHYSRSMPTPPVVKIGAWENDEYIGCVLFSRGANNNLMRPYNLLCTQGCELTRIALRDHNICVSKIISIAIRMVSSLSKDLRLIVSFADPNQGHIGIIYQASNWIYSGLANSTPKYITADGKTLHNRQVSKSGTKRQYGELRKVPKITDCIIVPQLDKHRYLYPLDKAMRRQVLPLAKPYPKKETCGQSIKGDTSEPTEGAGSIPADRS